MRVIFDTNAIVSALLFRGAATWLVEHWQSGEVTPMVSRETARELLRVLAYPKFGLPPPKWMLLPRAICAMRCGWNAQGKIDPQRQFLLIDAAQFANIDFFQNALHSHASSMQVRHPRAQRFSFHFIGHSAPNRPHQIATR
jgi:hypothetical protein